MLVALIASQMMAYGPPPPCRCQCDCPPPRYERSHEEVRLNDSFFIGEGGVGPAFTPPVYSNSGYVVFEGGGFNSSSSFARSSASASASARASASANVRVRIVGGGGGYHSGRPSGGHHGY